MRALTLLIVFQLFIGTDLLIAQELNLERVTILNQKKEIQTDSTNTKGLIQAVFSENDILVIAESEHFVKESHDFIVEVIKESAEFNCHHLVLECSTAKGFILDNYILPPTHEDAEKYVEFRNAAERAFFDNLYALNLSRPKEDYIRICGIEGYMNTSESVINAWKYFSNHYLTNLVSAEFSKVVNNATKDHKSVRRIRDYILLNENKLKREIKNKSTLESYELLKQALDDVFEREEINKLFRSNWIEGAKKREDLSINYFTDILGKNKGKKFLSLYGGWHVEKRTGKESVTNIFSYLNYKHPSTKGKVHSWHIGFSSIDLETLEPSRDYKKMYHVYAAVLKELHNFKDKNPNTNKMPYFELNNKTGWEAVIRLFADAEKVKLISTEQENRDLTLLQKYDEVILLPLGHYWELITR